MERNLSQAGVVPFGVVVLNYNCAALTIESIESLQACNPRPSRVVLVDNASSDDSLPRLLEWARGAEPSHISFDERDAAPERERAAGAWLTVITASHNGGFARGNNIGLRHLAANRGITHFFLLNNDATVETEYFRKLSEALAACPGAGLLSGSIYCGDPSFPSVWYAGGHEIPWRALVVHDYTVPNGLGPIPTEMVCGCTMLISRELFDRLGGLPECYALVYGEDAEYSHRAREAGFPVVYAPAARAHHKVGATVGPAAQSAMVTFCQNRHRAFFVRRNYTGLDRVVALAYLLVTKPVRSATDLIRGRPKIAWATLSGMMAGVFSPAAKER